MSNLSRLIISAPFGNHLRWPGVTSTIGTYTLYRRAGALTRLWRALTTIRYNRRTQTWINRMRLPSPGINSLVNPDRLLSMLSDKILSIHGLSLAEWATLAALVAGVGFQAIELNVSCPNVDKDPDMILGAIDAAQTLTRYNVKVIAKLPPIRWMDLAAPLYYEGGVRCFHLCNTMPSPGGGISGKVLKQYSLRAVEEISRRFKDVDIIGGGGITDISDIKDYLSAGANRLAIGSMLFNPLNWRKVPKMVEYLESNH